MDDLDPYLEGKKVLFMLDEFEGIIDGANEGVYDKYIFEAFRNMMQHREDSRFILVGADKIVEMLNDYASTIFSISVNIPVSFLDHQAAKQMIVEMAPEITYTENAIKRLLELTNGHPYYTKILCSSIIQHLNDRKRNTVYLNDVDKVTESIVMHTHGQYFGYIWEMFDPLEKLIVSYLAKKLNYYESNVKLAEVEKYFSSYRQVTGEKIIASLEKLVNRDILDENKISLRNINENEYSFSIDLYRKWFKYNKPLVKTELEVKSFVDY